MTPEGLLGSGLKLVFAFATSSIAALRSATDKISPNRSVAPEETRSHAPEVNERALSSEQQWDKVADVVNEEIGRARSAAKLQSAAAEQLDAASYTFSRIMAEISGTMQETRTDVSKLIEKSADTEREMRQSIPEEAAPPTDAGTKESKADAKLAA